MARDDYYSLLGVDKLAPEREIKRAYYKIARDLHPDKAKTPEEARQNAERLAVISKAYNTLKDPKKRAEYDGKLSGVKSSAPAAPAARGSTPPPADPPTAASSESAPPAGATPTPRPRVPGGTPNPAPRANISAQDMASQRVLTAQKAFVKGIEFYRNAEYKKALPFLEAAVNNDPEGEAQYHMKLAICLMKTKGSFSRAVQAAERACELEAYNMDFKLGLAEIYETVGIESKAESVYEDILKWDADNDRAKSRLRLLKTRAQQKSPSIMAKIFPSIFGKK